MKTLFLSLSFLVVTFLSIAQPVGWQDKVKWSFKIEKIDDSHATIVGTAKLLDGWHIFSVNHDPEKADFTGVPTTFNLKSNKDFKVIGKLKDGKKAKVLKDDLGTQLYFEGTGVFKQEIEVLTDKPFKIPLAYSFQICDEAGCIFPPEQEVLIEASGFKPVLTAQVEEQEETSTTAKNSAPNSNKTIAKEKIEPEKKL